MKKSLVLVAAVVIGISGALFAQDVDKFLRASDGEVVGVLMLGKKRLSISGTIEEITWTGKHGTSVTLRFDGTNVTCMGTIILTAKEGGVGR